jgi:hypothetical protein
MNYDAIGEEEDSKLKVCYIIEPYTMIVGKRFYI